jgi:HNH endonuclease
MKFKLENKNVELYCEVDEESYQLIKDKRWFGEKHTYSKKYYVVYRYNHNKRIYLHRFLLSVTDSKIQVDHKDGNTLNNKLSNIRACPKGKYNAINRPKQRNNTSGYKGVFKREDTKTLKYRAAIRVDQRLISLGTFENPKEAAKCYNEAAIKYFGEFAHLNKIED